MDLEGDNLVVGAPDTDSQRGAVYVYKLENDNFDLNTPKAIAEPTVLSPTNEQEGREFGTSLAFGDLEGPGKKKLLAVGAPASDVASSDQTTANAAGKIFFYDKAKDFVSTAVLATPVERDRLGRALKVLPFKRGDTTYDVLVSSAVSGLYAFWAFLTPDHDDVRGQ